MVMIRNFKLYNVDLEKGHFFNDYQVENGIPVCVIGANIASKIFSGVDAVDKYLGNPVKLERGLITAGCLLLSGSVGAVLLNI